MERHPGDLADKTAYVSNDFGLPHIEGVEKVSKLDNRQVVMRSVVSMIPAPKRIHDMPDQSRECSADSKLRLNVVARKVLRILLS